MRQTIADLTSEQLVDLDEWLRFGMDIMAQYGVDPKRSVYENLDMVYEAWVADKARKATNQEIIVGLGTVFGNRLGNKHGARWQIVSDEYGTAFMIAIKGRQIYPMDFVAKRIATLTAAQPEAGFFAGMDAVIDAW